MVQVRTLSTSTFGITVMQTIVDGLVIGSTVRLVTGAIEGFEGRTTFDVDAGAMVSAAISGVASGRQIRHSRACEHVDVRGSDPT